MFPKDVKTMSEAELRAELERIRGERAGKGRQKRTQARERRVSDAGKQARQRKNAAAEAEADWV